MGEVEFSAELKVILQQGAEPKFIQRPNLSISSECRAHFWKGKSGFILLEQCKQCLFS